MGFSLRDMIVNQAITPRSYDDANGNTFSDYSATSKYFNPAVDDQNSDAVKNRIYNQRLGEMSWQDLLKANFQEMGGSMGSPNLPIYDNLIKRLDKTDWTDEQKKQAILSGADSHFKTNGSGFTGWSPEEGIAGVLGLPDYDANKAQQANDYYSKVHSAYSQSEDDRSFSDAMQALTPVAMFTGAGLLGAGAGAGAGVGESVSGAYGATAGELGAAGGGGGFWDSIMSGLNNGSSSFLDSIKSLGNGISNAGGAGGGTGSLMEPGWAELVGNGGGAQTGLQDLLGAGSGGGGGGWLDFLSNGIGNIGGGDLLKAGLNYAINNRQSNKAEDLMNQLLQKGNALDQPQRAPFQTAANELLMNPQSYLSNNPFATSVANFFKNSVIPGQVAKSGNPGKVLDESGSQFVNAISGNYNNLAQILQGYGGYNQGPGSTGAAAQVGLAGLGSQSEAYRGFGSLLEKGFPDMFGGSNGGGNTGVFGSKKIFN